MNQPLKPCPFCGGIAKIYKGEPVKGKPNLPSFVFVYCDTGCRNRTRELYDEAAAVESWNTRVGDEWIDCTERLPENFSMAWAWCTRNEGEVVLAVFRDGGFFTDYGWMGLEAVAKWQVAIVPNRPEEL